MRRLSSSLAGVVSMLALAVVPATTTGAAVGALADVAVAVHPAVSDYVQVSTSETPPTEAQCASVGRRCFTPQSTRAAYDLQPLYDQGLDGTGMTIAVVDSYGSDTMPHDLHVYNQAFGLPPMCGEEGVACAPGMPTFSTFHFGGSPATKEQPGSGTKQEDKSAWALEVALDVEVAHAIAPGANILLVATNTAETLGVQGFPQMMKAEQYVVDHHMADVISQSFGSSEEAFGSPQSLQNLRGAFIDAAQQGVTVLASSGDNGTAMPRKSPVGGPNAQPIIPEPTVGWPASDPLVTGIGGTYLCTDPNNTTSRVVDSADPPAKCGQFPGQAEIGWTPSGGGFSHVFAKPDYQAVLPAGSTPIGSMRGVPDVALQASATTGQLVYLTLPPRGESGLICPGGDPCSTGWYDIGGTSLSTPEWAGMIAIADQMNGGRLGFINPALYAIAADPASYSTSFFDVTTGNNTVDPSVPGYPATIGWDPITGLGTPDAAQLLPALVAAVNS